MKKIIALFCAAALMFSLCACASTEKQNAENSPIRVFMINGPTGIGAVNLMENSANGKTANKYNFSVVTEPNEIVAKISTGQADIAAISTNLAAKIYNKTGGGVYVLAVNTSGVLKMLTMNTEIKDFNDLKGKKVYAMGKGANPETIINYLLKRDGIKNEELSLNFLADASELATVFAKEPNAVIIAPEPAASSILIKYPSAKVALDLTDEWCRYKGNGGIWMGCIIARKDFVDNNASLVEAFLNEYEASVKSAETDVKISAELCEKYGIIANRKIAEKSLPQSNICFVSGEKMKRDLSKYLNVLYNFDNQSIGGKLPKDDFYYEGKK